VRRRQPGASARLHWLERSRSRTGSGAERELVAWVCFGVGDSGLAWFNVLRWFAAMEWRCRAEWPVRSYSSLDGDRGGFYQVLTSVEIQAGCCCCWLEPWQGMNARGFWVFRWVIVREVFGRALGRLK